MRLKKSAKNREKGVKGYQRFLFRIFIITLIPVSLAGAIFLFLSLYLFLREAPFLRLTEATIEGNNRISKEEILAMTGLTEKPNILTLDIKTLNRNLGHHPWIEKSMIRRVFPDGIRIVIHERVPVAIIHLEKLYYIDENRVIFDEVNSGEKSAYPILTGISSEEIERDDRKLNLLLRAALHLLKVSQGNAILSYPSISQIHLDRAVGLLVYKIDKGTEFSLGFASFETKLERLSKIWPLIRSMELASIDCTIPERIIVRKKR